MRMRTASALFAASAMLVLLFSGCTPSDDITLDATSTAAAQSPQATAAATAEAMPTPVPTPGPTLSPTPSPTPTVEPTPSPTPTPTLSPTPEPLTVTVTKEHLTVTSGVCRYDVYVPVFAVTGSDTLLSYLNAHIRDEMLAIVTRFTTWAAANPPVPPAGLNDLSFDFEVTLNDGQYLSLYGIASAYMGGATTDSFGFSFTVNVANQTIPTLTSLLGADYEIPVSSLIESALTADYGDAPVTANLFSIAPGSDFVTGDNPHFYLTPTHMGFIFDKYVLYPGAYGAPRVEVAISDLPGPFGGGAAETHMALCTGFDSATGAMVFDYVEILTGDEAVTALAADQGITEAQAHDIIYDHDPNEYIRNQNPLLRTFTVNASTYIAMIYGSDGTILDPGGYFITYADFTSLYAARPGVVVSEYQLYSITVSGNQVLAMEQVYRP